MFGTLRCCLILDSGVSLLPSSSSLLSAVLKDGSEVSSSVAAAVAASPELTTGEIFLRD